MIAEERVIDLADPNAVRLEIGRLQEEVRLIQLQIDESPPYPPETKEYKQWRPRAIHALVRMQNHIARLRYIRSQHHEQQQRAQERKRDRQEKNRLMIRPLTMRRVHKRDAGVLLQMAYKLLVMLEEEDRVQYKTDESALLDIIENFLEKSLQATKS